MIMAYYSGQVYLGNLLDISLPGKGWCKVAEESGTEEILFKSSQQTLQIILSHLGDYFPVLSHLSTISQPLDLVYAYSSSKKMSKRR